MSPEFSVIFLPVIQYSTQNSTKVLFLFVFVLCFYTAYIKAHKESTATQKTKRFFKI